MRGTTILTITKQSSQNLESRMISFAVLPVVDLEGLHP